MATEIIPFLIVKGGKARVLWLGRTPTATRFHQLIMDLSTSENLGGSYSSSQVSECISANKEVIENAVIQLAHNRAAAYLPK